jgi:transposase-like protein
MGIWIPQGRTRGRSKGAFRGDLSCPVCKSQAIRFLENIGPYRLRYRCRKCGLPFQYETGRDMSTHPYAPFAGKAKFRDAMQYGVKGLPGRKLRRK